ncbi:MAG: single-stranded-DNA-specific exonuclease RecJ [Verrucomicrobiota bacterium]|nr:single-stranded-DNA-specific exonuclease RecJ [Verrucomicrobiota bacterium]
MPTPFRWLLPEPLEADQVRTLAVELGVSPLLAELLCRRGFAAPADAESFLAPRLKTLSDPFLLPDMAAAVERIFAALDRGERIVLYGDYDVDGITSLALLTRVLRAFGAAPQCFLPLRIDEGYGLSPDGVARCVSTCAPQLLIAVDCGTSSAIEIAHLRAQGIDVVVLDHHEIKSTLPDCSALVNPKRGDTFHYLCSAGLAFKLAHAMLKRRPLPGFDLREHLDLVALGTVADIVPLTGENRILVKRGLAQIAATRWPGLRALLEVAAVRPPFSPMDVGFKLGPRMNAAGRLGTAQDALELLLTGDPFRARTLAHALDQQNRERRAVEDAVFIEAERQLATWFDAEREAAIVVGDAGWHPGVVGIVASRLANRHHRPALVIGFDERGLGKGSGRSIAGLSLVQALGRCGEFLEKFGGHEMAAGLTMQFARFEEFRDAFRACARESLSAEQLEPRLRLHAELMLRDICFRVLEQHDVLQPFGMGNDQPVFLARGVTLASEPRVLKEKHLALILRQGRDEFRAVWFHAAEEALPRFPWDVAFEIERHEYQGFVTPQLQIKAVRTSS